MKKFLFLSVMMLMLFSVTAQPLTHRGGKAMPAEMVIAEFSEFKTGDKVIGCYTYDNQLYASEIRIARDVKFQITTFGDDQDTPVKTGAYTDEDPVYVLLRDGKTFLLDIAREKDKYWNRGKLFNTGIEVTVNDNLYYSLCPEWPDSTEVDIAGNVRLAPYSEPFYKWFRTHVVRPNYYADLELELVTGSGLLRSSRTLNFYKYRFHPDDFNRGYIEIKFTAIPLVNCQDDDPVSRVIKVNL